LRKKRVLIVDDEEDLTWTLVKKLSKDSDKFELICVNSGQEARDVLSQVPVDLVITDVRMPEVSGLDLLVEIKEKYPSTKVIIMTAYGSSDVQKAATDRGCLHYIEKPFEINELRQLILDSLAERKGFRGNVSDFQLSDIIQLNCLGRLNSALQVRHEGEEGIIYFQEGNIVHAEVSGMEGEKAFYYIMSWQGGEFAVVRNRVSPKETITKGWQSLLLEGMRRADEFSEMAQEDRELQKQTRLLRLKQLLEKLVKVRDVVHVLILTKGGFPTAYLGRYQKEPDKISSLGNQISNMLDGLLKYSKFISRNGDLFLEMHRGTSKIILQNLSDNNLWLAIIGRENMNPGYLRIEMKKLIPEIRKLV